MAFDFKKEYKAYYLPKNRPELIEVPPVRYLSVPGQGDPNEKDGAYKQALGMLYTVAYTIKMSKRSDHRMAGYFDFVVPPLEGFWWREDGLEVDLARKTDFCWRSVLRVPEFVTDEDLRWAVAEAGRKKKLDCSPVELYDLEEGLCVQMLHIGPYDDEPESIARMEAFLREEGYETDLTDTRRHHEIYLSDVRRVPQERWRTVIRLPVRRGE